MSGFIFNRNTAKSCWQYTGKYEFCTIGSRIDDCGLCDERISKGVDEMEGIVEINKDDYIDQCLKIVKEMVTTEDFSDEIWLALTSEIMDTCVQIGGDYNEDSIRFITQQYLDNKGIHRFKKAHGIY